MFNEYETLYALDIVNPFTKTVKIDNLTILVNRINEVMAYDKVGSDFYYIEDVINGDEPIGKDFTDLVVKWLNHLNSLRTTKHAIGFDLDKSI